MNDNELGIKIGRYITIAFCTLMVLCFGSCQNTKYQIVRAIEAGATPADAACAITDKSVGQFCAFVAASK